MGSGFKDWAAGDVLTAADVDGYLMRQTVMTFADASARDTALSGVLDEGMTVYLEDGDSLFTYDGAEWVPVLPTGVGGRNILYNGAMQIAQRSTSETGITSSGYYTADRWRLELTTLGTWTQTEESDAPTGSGFSKSTKLLCTTADASPAAGDAFAFMQRLEGQDLQLIKKGTASAEQLTLSFWVKSNTTGTYIAELVDTDNGRAVSASYSVSASGTWEKKTITYPADTVGPFTDDNANSLELLFWLGAGTDWTSGSLQTTWGTTTDTDRAVGQTNLAAATNNYWQITGVQLELGNKATAFDHLTYPDELRRCERYYQGLQFFSGFGEGTTRVWSSWPFRTEMRTNAPSLVKLTGETIYVRSAGASDYNFTVTTLSGASPENTFYNVGMNGASGLTDGHPYIPRGYDGGNFPMELDDEL